MKWYWIVLIVVGYIVMWFLTAVLLSRREKSKDTEWSYAGACWPFILAAIPFILLMDLCHRFVKKYGKEGGQ